MDEIALKSQVIDTEQRQETDYHYQLQSFIYSLLENSAQFSQLHDKKGYKFFCFSNIFSPSGSNDNTDIRYIIISSPSRDFVRYVSMMLIKIKERQELNQANPYSQDKHTSAYHDTLDALRLSLRSLRDKS